MLVKYKDTKRDSGGNPWQFRDSNKSKFQLSHLDMNSRDRGQSLDLDFVLGLDYKNLLSCR